MASNHPIPYTVTRDKLVHVVDADLITCEKLSVLLRIEGYQTAFSTNSAQFFASSASRPPSLTLINLGIDGGGGLSMLKQVRTVYRGAPVIMLADTPNMDAAVGAMKLGAGDVVPKPIDAEWLLTIIREAFRRDVHLGASINGHREIEVRGFSQLTNREREVLQLIAEGKSNKFAGRELGISPRTIEVHRARVMDKLGAKNTADLMRIVLTS